MFYVRLIWFASFFECALKGRKPVILFFPRYVSAARAIYTSYFLPKLTVRLTVLFSVGAMGAEIQQVLLEGLLRSVSSLAG